MSNLTFPVDNGVPTGAKFSDRGCLSCPPGKFPGPDAALSILEKATNNILTAGVKDYRAPSFPLSGRPVKKASFEQMSVNSKIRYHAFFSDVHRTKFHNPMPDQQNFAISRKLIEDCGGDVATAQLIANANSIGCAPPRGDRGLTGKDRYYSSAATAVFELGPFCITDYLDLNDFGMMLGAYKTGAIRAAGTALEYEKIRRFVDMSRKNGSAIAGTFAPRFFNGVYGEIPNSPGSFEWILNAIDSGIGGEISMSTPITVYLSRQLLKYYIEKYAKDQGVEINASLANIRIETQGHIASFENANTFSMMSLRTNRKVNFVVEREPVYVEVYTTGDAKGEWDFQRYYITEPGDDDADGAANGFRQSANPDYGNPLRRCEGVPRVLCEQILIDTGTAFHYEAFPTNPLGARIEGVETDLQNLWGATEIMWYFGSDVDRYFLDDLNKALADTGAPCFTNIDKTWFAGRLKTGLQFVEDNPREMMSLLVAVPSHASPIEKSPTILPCEPPDAITITARAPKDGPEVCIDIPEGVSADEGDEGKMLVPNRLVFDLPCSGNKTIHVTFFRTDTNGPLTVPFTVTEDTALEGTAGTDHFRLANGNIVFADGEDSAQLAIVLHPIARDVEGGDPVYVNATINYTDSSKLDDGQRNATKLCLRLCQQAEGDGDDSCPDASCDCS